MSDSENLGSFFKENKNLVKDYFETRLEIFRLSAVRTVSKSAGNFVWIIISLFLLFLIILFAGLVLSFWLSDITHSFIEGFGITTILLLIIFTVLIIFRKKWFVDPIVQMIVERSTEDLDDEDETTEN
jgi:amino acid permease